MAAPATTGSALTAATDGFHDWAPFDDFKTTICGALGIFGTFEPNRQKEFLRFLPEIPEHDWNVILIPTARSIFDERFQLARRLGGAWARGRSRVVRRHAVLRGRDHTP